MLKALLLCSALTVSLSARAGERPLRLPDCTHMGETQNTFNTAKILRLKRHSPESTQAVALIRGTVLREYYRDDVYLNFELKIGPGASDTVEIFYSSIAPHPRLRAGDRVIACGIYQTNREPSYAGPPSPDGAFLFDTNFAAKPTADDGFLVVNGVLFAQ